MSIEKLTRTLKELNLLDLSGKQGCTEAEISALERKYNVTLPDSYRVFLVEYGHSGSNIFDRAEIGFEYKAVIEITDYLTKQRDRINTELREEGGQFEPYPPFPEKILFVAHRYGEQFCYIIANGGMDAAVFYYRLDERTDQEVHEKRFDSVWDWLNVNAREHRVILDSIARHKVGR